MDSSTNYGREDGSNSSLNKDLIEALGTTMLRFKKVFLHFPPGNDIHMSELAVMRHISCSCSGDNSEYIASVSDLQRNTFISKPAVSQILRSLEKKGYIKRGVNLNDRRKIIITLTPKGQEVLDIVKRQADYVLSEIITSFGEDNTGRLVELFSRFADISDEVMGKLIKGQG